MENSMAYKWVAALFFGIVGIMFTASVVYLAAGNVAPDTYFGRKMALPKSTEIISLWLSGGTYLSINAWSK